MACFSSEGCAVWETAYCGSRHRFRIAIWRLVQAFSSSRHRFRLVIWHALVQRGVLWETKAYVRIIYSPHTTILRYMCPHTLLSAYYLYYYICVLILLYMGPHTAIYGSTVYVSSGLSKSRHTVHKKAGFYYSVYTRFTSTNTDAQLYHEKSTNTDAQECSRKVHRTAYCRFASAQVLALLVQKYK